jgi:DNA-binding MarR family transcriptional regulator
MSSTLAKRLHQRSFVSPTQETILSLMVTQAWLSGEIMAVLSGHDVTLSQFNVLRILRGSHPDKLTCSAIGERLLDRTPDVTRLFDRLSRAGLTERTRSESDRRVVLVGITQAGLDVLSAIDPGIDGFHGRLSNALPPGEMETLNTLLERFREAGEEIFASEPNAADAS